MPNDSQQQRIFRAVAGAVCNTAHAHPNWRLSEKRAEQSIAKRATGTLIAIWREVLAASEPSDSEGGMLVLPREATGFVVGRPHRGERRVKGAPHKFLLCRLGEMAKRARKDDNTELLGALVIVMRHIANLGKEDQHDSG